MYAVYYVRAVSLLLIIYQYNSVAFLITHTQHRRGCIICEAGDNGKVSWNTHEHSRTLRYKSMTSMYGGTYAGQCPRLGWVDMLEPTPSKKIANGWMRAQRTGAPNFRVYLQ